MTDETHWRMGYSCRILRSMTEGKSQLRHSLTLSPQQDLWIRLQILLKWPNDLISVYTLLILFASPLLRKSQACMYKCTLKLLGRQLHKIDTCLFCTPCNPKHILPILKKELLTVSPNSFFSHKKFQIKITFFDFNFFFMVQSSLSPRQILLPWCVS